MDYDEVRELERQIVALHGPVKPYRPQRAGYVYFVQEGDDDGPVKIGWAADPARRLAGMQTGNPRPLRLLGAIKTKKRSLERDVHDMFSVDRLTGEWFAVSAHLLSYIEAASSSPEQTA